MRDGLYKVAFKTPFGHGTGVAYLHQGQLHGGDALQYYVGGYQISGNAFTAKVASRVHSHAPGQGSVFGIDNVNIKLTGTFQGDHATTKGTADEAPGVTFDATLERVAD